MSSVESITMQTVAVTVPPSARQAAKPEPSVNQPATAKSVAVKSGPSRDDERAALEQAVTAVQKFTQPLASNLQFSIDEETGIKMVKVIDTATKEVIRQIPSEEMMEIAKALDRLQGILIQQKA